MSRRRFQIDLGALMWLIAIFCSGLVVIPAMLDRLDELMPKCLVDDGRSSRPPLNASMDADESGLLP